MANVFHSGIECKVLRFKSPEQLESIELRREVLRKPLGLDFNTEDLDKEMDQIHIGAFIENRLVGVLLLKTMKDLGNHVLKMRQVAVDPGHQGKGVGRSMVVFSENWAHSNSYSVIDLHARKNVVPFYENLGYEVVGEEFLEVGIPHLKMIKHL